MKKAKNGSDIKINRKNILIFLLLAYFLYSAIKYFNIPGSDIPIISNLFNMIIILGLIIFFFHKEEIEENIGLQTSLDKYFKRDKNNGENN